MTINIDLLIHSANQICTIPDNGRPQRGHDLGQLGIITDGAIAINDGHILAIGPSADLQAQYTPANTLDATNHCLLPGFVDPHTHIPWAGDRAAEFEMRVGGATYMDIMAAGGGIMSTVLQTRLANVTDLVRDNLPRLRRMLQHGTTSAETKTGYGLDLPTEIKQLDAIVALNNAQPIDLTPTFLPAHAVPAEYKNDPDAFVTYVIDEILPAGAEWMKQHHLTLFCDVFCEAGVFDVNQTRRILERGRDLGYELKLHADEFEGLGGTALAASLGATSADHLVKTPDEDIIALGLSETIAVGLPGTPFGLGHHEYTPAQKILDAGGALALATDCNPGTCWCESQQMVIALACRYMGLTPAQALVATTLNAAYAIRRGDQIGSLTPGKQADIIMLTPPDYRHLGYRFGTNLVHTVIKQGEIVAQNL
ncbi:MAG TPA: imidazolonepropionase [Anaerolineae bacterium]|nr:imidazolonepropionase [Anaerolineae bacterium]